MVDNGGSGQYKAVAATEKSLPDFVVYRPENIKEAVKEEGKLPILVWANGGCMNSSIHHEKLLTEVASHGYIIVEVFTRESVAYFKVLTVDPGFK